MQMTSPPLYKAAGQKMPWLPPSLPAAAKITTPFFRAVRIASSIDLRPSVYSGNPNDRLMMSARSSPVEKCIIA